MPSHSSFRTEPGHCVLFRFQFPALTLPAEVATSSRFAPHPTATLRCVGSTVRSGECTTNKHRCDRVCLGGCSVFAILETFDEQAICKEFTPLGSKIFIMDLCFYFTISKPATFTSNTGPECLGLRVLDHGGPSPAGVVAKITLHLLTRTEQATDKAQCFLMSLYVTPLLGGVGTGLGSKRRKGKQEVKEKEEEMLSVCFPNDKLQPRPLRAIGGWRMQIWDIVSIWTMLSDEHCAFEDHAALLLHV
ncbi:hypothetical protein H920_11486 [Fukomys damarensis]|uniref:Uncharacterized protein n=1 Tax=Fukomys damarensis TaxID=885580 RepID=A0A091DWA0_FUKDA|nr:hypothetical protein H920_11486 [Fukomys damarensis]